MGGLMDTDKSAINTMLAHEARVNDENAFVRSKIEGYAFALLGIVTKYSNGRVDVRCGGTKFTNVEVMVVGVNGWGIKPVPAKDDRVFLISTANPTPDIKTMEATCTMPPYDVSGLKAIPVTDEDTAQLFTVDKDGITLEGNNKLTLNDDGLEFEDANGNKVTTSEDGVSFEDLNGNKVDTTDSGVAFEDLNKNKITTDDSGVKFEDKNGNKVTTESSGITIEDKNGCKIVSSSSSVKINNKLEIKK